MPRWEKKRKLLSEGTYEAVKEGTWDGLGELAGYNEGLLRKEGECAGRGRRGPGVEVLDHSTFLGKFEQDHQKVFNFKGPFPESCVC